MFNEFRDNRRSVLYAFFGELSVSSGNAALVSWLQTRTLSQHASGPSFRPRRFLCVSVKDVFSVCIYDFSIQAALGAGSVAARPKDAR